MGRVRWLLVVGVALALVPAASAGLPNRARC
jgi:hypothetical protein